MRITRLHYSSFILAFLLACDGCTTKPVAKSPEDDFSGFSSSNSTGLFCNAPNRAEIGKPFTMIVSIPAPEQERPKAFSGEPAPLSKAAKSTSNSKEPNKPQTVVSMGDDKAAKYEPKTFFLSPGHQQSVSVTLLTGSGTSGLASVKAFPSDDLDICERVIDVGFQGHLQLVNTEPLTYTEARAFEIQLLDANNKPMSLGMNVAMEVQSADAALGRSTRNAVLSDDGDPVTLAMPAGSSSTGPFRLASTNWKGGSVHLSASLRLENDATVGGAVLTQNTFTFDSNPVWWLPITLAISGALIYALYKVSQSTPPFTNLRSTILSAGITSVLAGIIAWLFADFDLLGIKLDPHVLRTYPLLGFIFSFVGIDVLLKGKFSQKP